MRPLAKTTSHNLNLPRASQEPHSLVVPIRARVGTVRASRVKTRSGHIYADIATLREREKEMQSIGFDNSEYATGNMTPPAKATLRKLVPLKVPYAELQTYRQELVALHLDFLL